MNSDPNSPDAVSPVNPENDATGLPGLKSWRTVYLFVTVVFIVYTALLFWLSKAFA
jgi:hypothetical protein